MTSVALRVGKKQQQKEKKPSMWVEWEKKRSSD
jgi:hypothetical protein